VYNGIDSKKLFSPLRKPSFLSNVMVLAGGTALAQGLTVLASPLLTRLYTPDDFGVLAVYTSMLALLVVVSSWRYGLAIPLPEDGTTAANVLVLSLTIVLGMSLFVGVGVWALGDWVVIRVNVPVLKPYLWLLPLSLFCAGGYGVLNYWAVRNKAFSHLAKTKLYQGLGRVVTQVGLGLLKFGPVGLLLGEVAGSVSGNRTLAMHTWRQDREVLKKVSISGVRQAAYRYRDFPLFSSVSSLLNTAGLQLPALLLATFYGIQIAGWFALGQRVIAVPMSMVGMSVAQVYFSEASKLARENPKALQQLFYKIALRLFAYGAIPIGLLAFGGPWLFAGIFGEVWREAGKYTQLLALMFLAKFVVGPLSHTLIVLERQDLQLCWDASRLVLVVGTFLFAHYMEWTSIATIAVYAGIMVIAYVSLLLLCSYVLSSRVRDCE